MGEVGWGLTSCGGVGVGTDQLWGAKPVVIQYPITTAFEAKGEPR